MLLFLSSDNDNVGLNVPVGVAHCPAVTPLAVDFDGLIKLELWVGHLISSLLTNTGLYWPFAKSSDAEIFSQKISVRRITFFPCHYRNGGEGGILT